MVFTFSTLKFEMEILLGLLGKQHLNVLYTSELIGALWLDMATKIWVNISSSNGLLPDGTRPSPESM